MYILDTDHLSFLQRKQGPDYVNLQQRLHGIQASDVFVTIVSFHEQIMGWNAYLQRMKTTADVVRGYARMARVLDDFSVMQMLTFDAAAAQEFDRLRQQRMHVGAMGLRIAAIGLSRNFVILTRNFADFSKVPGLQVEDWTAPKPETEN